jgi:hypothetical protein
LFLTSRLRKNTVARIALSTPHLFNAVFANPPNPLAFDLIVSNELLQIIRMTNYSEIKSERVELNYHALLKELEQKSKVFDYHIEHDADCETARGLYKEIKELRSRIYEISMQE